MDNELKPISADLASKVIRFAAEVCAMHGSVAGNRICQDWSNEDKAPADFFTEEEMCLLEYNYQCWNGDWDGYEDGQHWFHDEMSASFIISRALNQVNESRTRAEPGWISVDERLPAPGMHVAVLINGRGTSIASYDEKYNGCWRIGNDYIAWDYDYSFGVEMDITHWMPLPEPPKE